MSQEKVNTTARLKPGEQPPKPISKVIYEVFGAICVRCEYEWIPKVWPPKRCPNCGDPRWDRPYIYAVEPGKKSTKQSRAKGRRSGR